MFSKIHIHANKDSVSQTGKVIKHTENDEVQTEKITAICSKLYLITVHLSGWPHYLTCDLIHAAS